MKTRLIVILLFAALAVQSQSYVFGVKGGPVIATQNWNNSQRNPLVDLHGIFSIESWGEDDPNVLFAQVGYHTRGSSLRQLFINPTSGFIPQTRSFKFRNLALTVGAKRRIKVGNLFTPYYSVGLRGEYTVTTNLDEFFDQNFTAPTAYPLNEFVNKWNYGIYGAGGVEFAFTEYIGGVFELSINPDLSRQYFQPPLNDVSIYNAFSGTTTRGLPEREIRNVTIELTLGLRFLRKVVYID